MTETTMWIVVVAAAVVVLAIGGWYLYETQRRRQIREGYGKEFDRAARKLGSPARAEDELVRREKAAKKIEFQPLSASERDRFSEDWRSVQREFVDRPYKAVVAADKLISDLMRARGYPLEDELQRHANLRVTHPEVLDEYRTARGIVERHDDAGADTEDLRQAMVHYRNLFGALLHDAPDRQH